MEIISRHKDSNGKLLGYTISNNGKISFVDINTARGMQAFIENATLTSAGEYRAKNGYQIDTIIDHSKLSINKQKPAAVQTESNFGNFDYYGKTCLNDCLKIRRYAQSGDLGFDETAHKANNGASVQLYALIRACGIDLETFIVNYMSTLQPYNLEPFQKKEALKAEQVWVIDIGYKISMIIKVNDNRRKYKTPVVISFHESNKAGKFMSGKKTFNDKKCAVIVDQVREIPGGYAVTYTIQRGFVRFQVNSATIYYHKGIALVDYADIEEEYTNILKNIFQNIQDTYLENISKGAPLLVRDIKTNEISFMSNGFATVNNLSLMLDLYNQYTDTNSRAMIVEIVGNLIEEMPDARKIELKKALGKTFGRDKNNNLLGIINNLLT